MHLESIIKLACLTEDTLHIPPPPTAPPSERKKAEEPTQTVAMAMQAQDTDALKKKLDEDIARVLEQELFPTVGVDHNADKKIVKAPLVSLENFDLESTEDSISTTSSAMSPRNEDVETWMEHQSACAEKILTSVASKTERRQCGSRIK